MPADLSTLLREAAETGPAPAPVDTTALWSRGRRRRRMRRAAPVMAVLVVVGLGATAVASVLGGDDLLQPLTTTEDGALALDLGWTLAPPGGVVALDELPELDPATDLELALTIPVGDRWNVRTFDVAADGTFAWVDPVEGVLLRAPGDDVTVVLGMPTPFLQVDDAWAVHSLQWGPDDRLYLSGQDPEALDWDRGLTQVAVIERDGTLIGVRDNDAGQFQGLLFADGYAWQRQTGLPSMREGEQRWQAVAEIGGPILQMPDQRQSEVIDGVAPDGMAGEVAWLDRRGVATLGYELQLDEELRQWRFEAAGGSETADTTIREGYRVATLRLEPGRGWLGGLFGSGDSPGGVLVVANKAGEVAVIRDRDVLDETGPNAIVIGRDGFVYLTTPGTDRELEVLRYAHPLPRATD